MAHGLPAGQAVKAAVEVVERELLAYQPVHLKVAAAEHVAVARDVVRGRQIAFYLHTRAVRHYALLGEARHAAMAVGLAVSTRCRSLPPAARRRLIP